MKDKGHTNSSLLSAVVGQKSASGSAFYPLDPQKKSAVTVRILPVVQSAGPQIRILPVAVSNSPKSNTSVQKQEIQLHVLLATAGNAKKHKNYQYCKKILHILLPSYGNVKIGNCSSFELRKMKLRRRIQRL